MPMIEPLAPAATDAATRQTLDAVRGKLGMIPNLFSTLAHAPAALNGYLALTDALGSGRLTAVQREIVALAVGQSNACHYCLSAHTMLARHAGLDEAGTALARQGRGASTLDDAIARFARQVVEARGRLSPGDLGALRRDGLDDALMIEVLGHVALNVLTNYTNHIAGTDVDFPSVAV